MSWSLRATLALTMALATPGHPAAAERTSSQTGGATPAQLAEIVARPVPLRTGIGVAHEVVTTTVARAQQFYDQGLAYLHSYVWIEAARSFNEALRADPRLAMAQLGLSYALGELSDGAGARAASQRATELATGASARERVRIELRARQLVASARPTDSAAIGPYRALLDRVGREYPSDVELLLVVGHAQDGGQQSQGMNGGSGSLRYYEQARTLAPDYFAVDHYIAHAYENLGKPEAALPFARRFAQKAPKVPHAHHMYGHVLRQVDRMREAIAEFRTADQLHTAYAEAEKVPLDLDWHYRHNLDLLATSYQYAGQMANAGALLRRSFETPASGHFGAEQDIHKRAWPLFLLGRRRATEALSAAKTLQSHSSALVQALGHILASRALQANGRLEDAAAEGNAALRQMKSLGPIGGRLVPDLELTQGEYLIRAGQGAQGATLLRNGVTKLMSDRSPDAWAAAVFQIEAAASVALERGQVTLAEELAARLHQHAPFYPGTHYLLGLLAEQRGDRPAARAAYGEALLRWRDADPDLPELKDVKGRVGGNR